MSTKFETYKGLNLPKIGEDILKFWEDEKVFEKSITSRDGKTPYVFLKDRHRLTVCPGCIMFWHVPLKTFFLVIKP